MYGYTVLWGKYDSSSAIPGSLPLPASVHSAEVLVAEVQLLDRLSEPVKADAGGVGTEEH